MVHSPRFGPRTMVLIPVLLALLLAVACGDDATATPLPTTTPTEPAATATPTPRPTPTNTPAPTKPKVERLVVAMTPPSWETTIPWAASTVRGIHKTIFEPPVGSDRFTAAYIPQLATGWEMSTDGLTWTVTLQDGIPFHFDWGEYTARDFRHTWERVVEEGLATDIGVWTEIFQAPEDIEIVNDHEIVMHLRRPEPEMVFFMAGRNGNFVQGSKAQWDAVGRDGVNDEPAGTGPWRFNEWKIGQSMLFDRVEDHWRHTPEFRELLMRFMPEDATRLATMVTGEAHMTDLPRNLHDTAIEQGMEVVSAVVPSSAAQWNFGGQYLGCTVPGMNCTPDKYDETNPLTNVKVREAIVHAINRQELLEEFYGGRGTLSAVSYNHPIYPSYDPTWDTRMETAYSYDPELSKQLLAEAGYPDGFDLTIISHVWTGHQEYKQVDGALALYLDEVGINVKLQDADWPRTREVRGKADFGSIIYGLPPYNLGPPSFIQPKIYGADGKSFLYTHPEIDEAVAELKETIDLERRNELIRKIGEVVFSTYGDITLFYVSQIILVDPNIVGQFNFPGTFTDGFSDLEYVVAGPGV